MSGSNTVLLLMDFQQGVGWTDSAMTLSSRPRAQSLGWCSIPRRVGAVRSRRVPIRLPRGAAAGELVLSGISTSGVVLSTLRQAADLDYGLTVLSDACGDPDPEVHDVLVDKVFPRQSVVLTHR